MEIPHAENILEIAGVGERVLAEIGDLSRFNYYNVNIRI